MDHPIRVIDLLCYPSTQQSSGATPEILPCAHPPETLLQRMEEAGVEKAFITQCKKWSCERQWICLDTRLEDVLRYTRACPERLIGLAGYNPYDMAGSLEEIEAAVREHSFRGVYVHAASFRLPLTDRHMYPLFAKAVELGVPVVVQLGNGAAVEGVFTLLQLERVAADFEDLTVLAALASWPERRELEWICGQQENVHFVLDPNLLSAAPAWAAAFLTSPCGRDRCCWGSHGSQWSSALQQVRALGLAEDIERKLLRDNASRIFRLGPGFTVVPRPRALPDPLVAER